MMATWPIFHSVSNPSIAMSPVFCLCVFFQLVSTATSVQEVTLSNVPESKQRAPMRPLPRSFRYMVSTPASQDDKQNVTWLMPGCGAYEASAKDNVGRRAKRTVGGEQSKKGQWPWMVAIHNFVDGNICGGILISDQHVLTAAHCVHYVPATGLEITLGTNDLYAEDALYSNVSSVYVHEEYDRKTIKNDFAILKLSEKVDFDQRLLSICMPKPEEETDNAMATVAGWGATYFGGPISDVLHHVSVPIWKQSKCKEIIHRKTRLTISESQMCAGYLHSGRDACQGDSGGPLMLQSASGQWVVAGIVSAGRGCGDGGIPGIYTRVSYYLKWIRLILDS